MTAHREIAVTVTYAEPHVQWSCLVTVAIGATVGDVLLASGFRQAHPGWDISPAGVGIDGRQVDLASPLANGDRVEVYRPLSFDPMVSRRRRAAHRARLAATALRPAKSEPALMEGIDVDRVKPDHSD